MERFREPAALVGFAASFEVGLRRGNVFWSQRPTHPLRLVDGSSGSAFPPLLQQVKRQIVRRQRITELDSFSEQSLDLAETTSFNEELGKIVVAKAVALGNRLPVQALGIIQVPCLLSAPGKRDLVLSASHSRIVRRHGVDVHRARSAW